MESAFEGLGAGKLPLMVEAFCPSEKEVSVLVCRVSTAMLRCFRWRKMCDKDNILDETTVPANISDECSEKSDGYCQRSGACF
ncbi:MAG: ATP-grasp domain-containing protein [Frisingicoccus sp.]